MKVRDSIRKLFFKTREELQLADKPDKTTMRENEHKILSVIASCQTMGQLAHANYWTRNMMESEDDRAVARSLYSAILCRNYTLIQEFNMKKANSRGQTIEEYTEGKQKTWYNNGFGL